MRIEYIPNGWRALVGLVEAVAGSRQALAAHLPCRLPRRARRLIVRVKPDEAPLSEQDRDAFWDAWGLPIFEEIRDGSGVLLAWECEAHDGYHVKRDAASALTHLGPIERTLCPCGQECLRLSPQPVAAGTR